MAKEQITNNIKVPNQDLEILKKHFPHCFDKDGNFQIEKFTQNLNEKEINFSSESYGMDWLGKSYARLLASDAATTLLKADENHNQKPENINSENLLIKGDNLEVLKHLANAYHEKIKMIYIDPPYNTGNDGFVYEDDRKFTVRELRQLAGIDEERAKRILDFTKSKSNSHSAWLTFMYPRLYIAKQLLKDDGVIFVSIDDNEVAQLRILMDEIFGEENFVALAPRKTGAGSAATSSESELRKLNDYVFIYQKTQLVFKQKNMGEKDFPYSDEFGDYLLAQFQASGSDATRSSRPNMYYPIYVLEDETLTTEIPNSYKKIILPNKVNGEDGRWLWKAEKFEKDKQFINYQGNKLQRKVYFDPQNDNTIYQVEKAYFEQFTNASGTKSFNQLFEPHKAIFSNPKPVELIKHLFNLINSDNDDDDVIILDFFAGSGTTGDAVMQLNAEDGGERKFILVQIPELIDKSKNKVAYDFVKNELQAEPSIFEITKERLLRAAKKINAELDEKSKTLALKITKLGEQIQTEELIKELKTKNLELKTIDKLKTQNCFKVFETMPIWEDYDFEAEELESELVLFDESKLTDEDVMALLTTWKTYDGIPLTQELESLVLSGEPLVENEENQLNTNNSTLKTNNYIAYYGYSKLYLMHRGFTTEHMIAILQKIDEDKTFDPKSIVAFGYHFDSKNLRELSESLKNYKNRKSSEENLVFTIRY